MSVVGLNRRFLAIGTLTLLLGSVSVIFTIGYFFFGWGGQYKYELFYFPSPVASTLDSLTSTGRMLSFLLPAVVFLTLLLTAAIIRIPSSKVLSTQNRHQQGGLPGAPKFKLHPVGILAISAAGASHEAEIEQARPKPAKRYSLGRLFPYDPNQSAARSGQVQAGLAIEPERDMATSTRGTVAGVINKNIT